MITRLPRRALPPQGALAVSLVALSCSCATASPRPAAPPPLPAPSACAVWDREIDFARSVQSHDTRGFMEHIHPGATFVSGDGLLRGPAAIAEEWKPFLVGEKARLDWHPTSVVLTGDQRTALSRGPFWIERLRTDANPRFLTGVFQSVWLLGDDGVWRVTVDGGTPAPVAATEEDVAKIKASLPARCPTGEKELRAKEGT